MADEEDSEFLDDDFPDESNELYGIRDGTLFLIDATAPMFENDPEEQIPYFLRCVKQYEEILKQKLVWNRQDWMGLMLLGTENCDPDSTVKNILTIQELSVVSMDKLKQVMKIDEGGLWKSYKTSASKNFPLLDAFWLSTRCFQTIDVSMPIKRVIFFTSNDDPEIDVNEKHRIRVRTKIFADVGIKLFVVGLGENWSHEKFYKDLEMQSRKIASEDYSKVSMKDLLQQIKMPARNMAKFCWRIGENVEIDVAVRNLCVKTQYLKMADISRETNEPLDTCTEFKVADEDDRLPILEMDMEKLQNFGGKQIRFTLEEVKNLNAFREPGIDLICVQSISIHLLFHFETPYFVIPKKNSLRKDNDLLFAALLNKCETRKLMIICAATIRKRSAPGLFAMIPHANCGGFYLYRIPFKGNVRSFKEFFPDYIFDDKKKKPPVEENGVELMRKMIEKLKVDFNPKMFSNPKLRVQLQTVDTLALDLEKSELPDDETLPKIDEMREKVADLLEEYDEIFSSDSENFGMPPRKKSKKENAEIEELLVDLEGIRKLVQKRLLDKLTIPQLKTGLKVLGIKATGRRKTELAERIKEFFE